MKIKRPHNSTTELPASLTNKLDQPNRTQGVQGVQDDGRFSNKKFKKSGAGNRKQARKLARQDKKQRKQQVYRRTHGFAVEEARPKEEEAIKKKKKQQQQQQQQQPTKKIKSQVDEKTKLAQFAKRNEATYQLLRKSNLVEDVDKEAGVVAGSDDMENREMRRLERNLGIKRGDRLENAFFDEGLGELFDGIEVGSVNVQKEEEEGGEGEEDDEFGLNEDEEGSELDSDVAEMYESQAVDANPTLETTEEPGANKYIPPSLRKRMLEPQDAMDPRVQSIRKVLQGQLNRLSETNIDGILGQIEAQYQDHPRQLVTDALTDLILQSIRSRIHMLDAFLYVNAALVGAVHRAVGLEPVAFLVQRLMEEFERRFREQTDGKECQNLCGFMAELYNFQIISCQLVYDVVRMCVEEVNEFTAELLLKLVRVSGVQLRKDDPLALKEIVQQVGGGQQNCKQLSVRCQFMVESLTNLRDNRLRNTMSASAENVARLKRFLGNMDKRRAVAGAVEPINIGLQDIREIKTKGKWWLVGASWAGNRAGNQADDSQRGVVAQTRELAGNSEMDRLLRVAKEQRMNTDVRRSIFVTLLSSDDYVDAFERLLKLDLKRTQVREVIRVLLHCCGQEAVYNPYYALVALKLCGHHNSYRLTMQYALWDFLRELGETDVGGLGSRIAEEEEGGSSGGERVPVRRVVNLAKLYGWLVDKGSLSLAVLKTVTFAKVGEQARVFFQMFFAAIFLQHQAQTAKDVGHLAEVFGRATANPTLCQGILFFFHHFVRRSELAKEGERPVMKWGCKLAKQVFRSSANSRI